MSDALPLEPRPRFGVMTQAFDGDAGKEAILLMRDAVTGGGYATIGTVIQRDLNLVAQAEPGSKVRFRAIDIDEALRARGEYASRLAQIAESLSLFDRVGLLGQ